MAVDTFATVDEWDQPVVDDRGCRCALCKAAKRASYQRTKAKAHR